VRAVLLAIAALGLSGCAVGRFPQLAQEDKALFFRCWPSMQRALCGDDRDDVYVGICRSDAQKAYADRPAAKRAKWLVARGCSKQMVAAAEEERDDDQ